MLKIDCRLASLVLILASLLLSSCSREAVPLEEISSSEELLSMFTEDQRARSSEDDGPTGPSDAKRRKRVFELIAERAEFGIPPLAKLEEMYGL